MCDYALEEMRGLSRTRPPPLPPTPRRRRASSFYTMCNRATHQRPLGRTHQRPLAPMNEILNPFFFLFLFLRSVLLRTPDLCVSSIQLSSETICADTHQQLISAVLIQLCMCTCNISPPVTRRNVKDEGRSCEASDANQWQQPNP